MKRSIKVDQKKRRGRPATGRGTMVSSRFPQPVVGAVDDWALKATTTRSDAIRRLVELGLTATTKTRARSDPKAPLSPKPIAKPGRRTRAKELASDAIEKMAD